MENCVFRLSLPWSVRACLFTVFCGHCVPVKYLFEFQNISHLQQFSVCSLMLTDIPTIFKGAEFSLVV